MAQPEYVTTAYATTAAAKLALAHVQDAHFALGTLAAYADKLNVGAVTPALDAELAAAHAAVQAAERAEDAALSRWARERRTGKATW